MGWFVSTTRRIGSTPPSTGSLDLGFHVDFGQRRQIESGQAIGRGKQPLNALLPKLLTDCFLRALLEKEGKV